MRAVPDALVVDAGILISALLGRSATVVQRVGASIALVASDRAIEEAARRVALGMRRPDLLAGLAELTAQLDVVPVANLTVAMTVAAQFLRDANQSRNGSTADAHIVALAWETDADVWSHDRDFAGTGVASWSTINLVRGLADRPREADA
ncbi:MAG TPA: PIN domain-containing protein [Caulobacteraceae bacterium]